MSAVWGYQQDVSTRTVDFHLDNVYEKLQVSNRMQALQRAMRLGLLPRSA